jgi:hypothetical protein
MKWTFGIYQTCNSVALIIGQLQMKKNENFIKMVHELIQI